MFGKPSLNLRNLRLYIFPTIYRLACLTLVTCFLALVTVHTFSRLYYLLHTFPPLSSNQTNVSRSDKCMAPASIPNVDSSIRCHRATLNLLKNAYDKELRVNQSGSSSDCKQLAPYCVSFCLSNDYCSIIPYSRPVKDLK